MVSLHPNVLSTLLDTNFPGGVPALLNNAHYSAAGQHVQVSGEELMPRPNPCFISPAFSFVAYPNRDSTPFKEWYNIPEVVTKVSLSSSGHWSSWGGWMTRQKIGWLRVSLGVRSCRRLLGLTIVLRGLSEPSFILNLLELMVCSALVERVKAICNFPSESESTRIISGLRWIGWFSQEKATLRAGNLLDTPCA